ncbi:MAG: BACON domain-containing protein, partial [Candidatus Cryptobacteroides sp.]
MKIKNIIIAISALSFIVISCQQALETPFELDSKEFADGEIGPDGGVRKVSIKSPGKWTASTQAPWITISPANGNASTECRILVDSTLQTEPRKAFVQFKLADGEYKEFEVKQKGYDYAITLKKPTVEIPEFADSDSRTFDVVVKSNTEFTVVIPDVNPSGLTCKVLNHEFDRGVRPRNVTVRFNWRVNSRPDKHETLVTFKPVKDVQLAQNDPLKVVQEAAQAIIPGTAEGDSLALLAIQRNMNVWSEFDTAEKMENWENVTVWRSGENKGRVRSARFFLFRTKEALPYEVKYLTAAEELFFYGNENSFLLDNLS